MSDRLDTEGAAAVTHAIECAVVYGRAAGNYLAAPTTANARVLIGAYLRLSACENQYTGNSMTADYVARSTLQKARATVALVDAVREPS